MIADEYAHARAWAAAPKARGETSMREAAVESAWLAFDAAPTQRAHPKGEVELSVDTAHGGLIREDDHVGSSRAARESSEK